MTSTGFEAVVLAGGKSTRLGRDKAAEVLAGVSLLQRVVSRVEGLVGRIVVVRARGQTLPLVQSSTSLVEVEDLYPDSGPLGGIITGLANLDTGAAFVTACDMPLVQPALVSALLGRSKGDRAVVPIAGGRRQPLCAVYARACAPVLERRLRSGDLRLLDALADLDVLEVQPETWRAFDPRGLSFLNINDESDLRAVEGMLRSEERGSLRCQVWYGDRRCGRLATHRTEHGNVPVCEVDAAVWGSLYEEVDEPEE